MANRPIARDVGWLFDFRNFCGTACENNLRQSTKLTTEKQNRPKPQRRKQEKAVTKFYNFFAEKKLIATNLLRLLIENNPGAAQARKFAASERDCVDKPTEKAKMNQKPETGQNLC